ncbi:MAG: hypothetical protein OXG44_06110 [Gammaproteobacteria bacterium]|nr:hypothetical protein [Gammaproteobacteria bacterium]
MARTTVKGYIIGLPNAGETQTGTVYVNFKLSEYAGKDQATGQVFRNVHRCVIFDQPARNIYLASELIQRMLVEDDRFDDDQFMVEGVLRPNNWEASDGTKYRDMQIRVESMAQLMDFSYANRFRPARPRPQLSQDQIEANQRCLDNALRTTLPEPSNQFTPAPAGTAHARA